MRESVDAAYSYVRSRANTLGVEDVEFKECDLHVHFPAGAIPKDGPSAGVTMFVALASALVNRPIRADIAMTREIAAAAKTLKIELHDHLVIGRGRHASFKALGLL